MNNKRKIQVFNQCYLVSHLYKVILYIHVYVTECVGAHSINCSEPCPASYYGGSCKLKCHCVITECDRIRGCPEGRLYSFISQHVLSC